MKLAVDATAAEKVCAIRAQMAGRIGPKRFERWFGESTELSLHDGCLHVTVPSAFAGQWISANFMQELTDATRDMLGSEARVELRVKQSGAASPVAARKPAPCFASPAGAPRAAARHPLRGELEAFVTGPSNRHAHSAACDIVQEPGQNLRLLVVHGGCGLGKTHLLQGICNGVARRHPSLEWRYVSGEEFTNEFVGALRTGRVEQFRARFRRVDVLAIDDIHFLAHKRATQEEFLHTFNAVETTGKAIVLSSDRHPRSIVTLSEPLRNRLLAGMVAQIDPPDLNMRREILRRRAQAMGVHLPEDVLDFISRRMTRNVREMEGALCKLVVLASLGKEPLDLALARLAVEDTLDATARTPAVSDIERVVANYFGLTREAMRSRARDRQTSLARSLAMYLLRRHTQMSFPEIGRALGHKNHSTVLMAVRRIERTLQRDGAVAWLTPSGLRETPVRDVLRTLEHDLQFGAGASA